MSLFVGKAKVLVQHPSWPDDQKVYIRSKMPFGVKREIDGTMFQVRLNNGTDLDAKAEMSAAKAETMRQMIVEWTLTAPDENGVDQPVPLTPENIDDLDAWVGDYIYQEISRLNPKLSQEERMGFPGQPEPASKVVALRQKS